MSAQKRSPRWRPEVWHVPGLVPVCSFICIHIYSFSKAVSTLGPSSLPQCCWAVICALSSGCIQFYLYSWIMYQITLHNCENIDYGMRTLLSRKILFDDVSLELILFNVRVKVIFFSFLCIFVSAKCYILWGVLLGNEMKLLRNVWRHGFEFWCVMLCWSVKMYQLTRESAAVTFSVRPFKVKNEALFSAERLVPIGWSRRPIPVAPRSKA